MLFLLSTLNGASSDKEAGVSNSNSFFPINTGLTLVYQSSFGESMTTYFQNGEFIISSSKADNFRYKQTLIITENGVYVKETYQFFKVLLFIKKEAKYTYGKPLLRFPLPLSPGIKWEWLGDEYLDGEKSQVKVTGKVIAREYVTTKAGQFESIKIESVVEGSSNAKNRVTEWYAKGVGLIKAKIVIEGGGVMGTMRDILGYGTIEFELKEIRKQLN